MWTHRPNVTWWKLVISHVLSGSWRRYHCGHNIFVEVPLLKMLNSYQASYKAIWKLLLLGHTIILLIRHKFMGYLILINLFVGKNLKKKKEKKKKITRGKKKVKEREKRKDRNISKREEMTWTVPPVTGSLLKITTLSPHIHFHFHSQTRFLFSSILFVLHNTIIIIIFHSFTFSLSLSLSLKLQTIQSSKA